MHTPAGTPIEVSVAAHDGGVRLEVRDHGPGLPNEEPDALFERFWRAEGGRERGKAGAGLGLAIVAAIVDAHGGEVAANNAPGGGALFAVELPAADRPPSAGDGPRRPPERHRITPSPSSAPGVRLYEVVWGGMGESIPDFRGGGRVRWGS